MRALMDTEDRRFRSAVAFAIVLSAVLALGLIVVSELTHKERVPPGHSGCKTYAALERAEEEASGYPSY